MAKVTAPKPEFIEINGKKQMLMSEKQLEEIYQFFSSLETEFNNLINTDEDPTESPLSYLDYLMVKLKVSQNFFPAGVYMPVHIAPIHLNTFIERMQAETRWRVANGSVTPSKSWLGKGGIHNLPDARGVVLRGWTDNSNTDPDGWNRPLGAFQDYAMKNHKHNTNVNYSTPMVGSNFPDFNVMRHLDGSINIQTVNTFDTNLSDHESRMKNISVLYLILT